MTKNVETFNQYQPTLPNDQEIKYFLKVNIHQSTNSLLLTPTLAIDETRLFRNDLSSLYC